MNSIKVGDKVVCINNLLRLGDNFKEVSLTVGSKYTVLSIYKARNYEDYYIIENDIDVIPMAYSSNLFESINLYRCKVIEEVLK